MQNCPLSEAINLKHAIDLSKQIEKSGIVSLGLGILGLWLGPIIGEIMNTIENLGDIGDAFVKAINDIVGSISPLSWALYIAQYQANLVRESCTWEITLLNLIKSRVRLIENKSKMSEGPYKKLEEICNHIRPQIKAAINNMILSSNSSIILGNLKSAKKKAQALKDILSLESTGISSKVLEIIKEVIVQRLEQEVLGEGLNLEEYQKQRKKPIKTALTDIDIKKFMSDNLSSLLDASGNYLIREFIGILRAYFEILRYYSGRDMVIYADKIAEQVRLMINDQEPVTAPSISSMVDIKKMLKDMGESAVAPFFTFDNDPNILEWVDGLNGSCRDLTVFGAQSQVLSGVEILQQLNKLMPDYTDQETIGKHEKERADIISNIKNKSNAIKNLIPDKCTIRNMRDRIQAWKKYYDIYRKLRYVDNIVADDLEKIEGQRDYAEKLSRAVSILNNIEWGGDEPNFTINFILGLGLHIVKDMLLGQPSYDYYYQLIDDRIAYLTSIKTGIKDLTGYSDPHIDGLIGSLRELGLMPLLNKIMQAEIFLNKISVGNAIIFGGGIGMIIAKCIIPPFGNPKISKDLLRSIQKTASKIIKRLEETFDKTVNQAIDSAMNIVGLGSDLVREVADIKIKMDEGERQLNRITGVSRMMSEVT